MFDPFNEKQLMLWFAIPARWSTGSPYSCPSGQGRSQFNNCAIAAWFNILHSPVRIFRVFLNTRIHSKALFSFNSGVWSVNLIPKVTLVRQARPVLLCMITFPRDSIFRLPISTALFAPSHVPISFSLKRLVSSRLLLYLPHFNYACASGDHPVLSPLDLPPVPNNIICPVPISRIPLFPIEPQRFSPRLTRLPNMYLFLVVYCLKK